MMNDISIYDNWEEPDYQPAPTDETIAEVAEWLEEVTKKAPF